MLGYTLSFVACMAAQPTGCKPVEIYMDGASMQTCMIWAQQAAAEWQSTWGKRRWFVDTRQRLRCIPPTKKPEANI